MPFHFSTTLLSVFSAHNPYFLTFLLGPCLCFQAQPGLLYPGGGGSKQPMYAHTTSPAPNKTTSAITVTPEWFSSLGKIKNHHFWNTKDTDSIIKAVFHLILHMVLAKTTTLGTWESYYR